MARVTRSAAAAAANASTATKPASASTKANTAKATPAPQQLSSPPATPISQKPAASRKRTRKAMKSEDFDINELPHNLGAAALPTPGADDDDYSNQTRPAKRTRQTKSKKSKLSPESIPVKEEDSNAPSPTPAPKKATKQAKKKFTPGISPYPDYPRPTPQECYEVTRILEKAHGKVNVPKEIPPPSLDIAGCGEVPSVLDALIRTLLSAATTKNNAATAFQGLVKRFGTLNDGIGKGSVDWNAVRIAPLKEVEKAIHHGGLAAVKSKNIQAILQIAYEENQERTQALKDPNSNPAGAVNESDEEKKHEIAKAEQEIITLDHIHLLSTPDAMDEMVKFPGIGLKTAACVSMFCLQRPVFAVDTHVYRLCRYLGWVPNAPKKGQPRLDRDPTFLHCDVRVPDELKYPLHQLLIAHGKVCPRCRAITGQSSAAWAEGCPIEHLVKRHGAKKGGISVADRKKAKEAAAGSAQGEEAADAAADAEGEEAGAEGEGVGAACEEEFTA